MCRDIANGGRRCPSHTNPVLIANRNAKRRKKYSELHPTPVAVQIPTEQLVLPELFQGRLYPDQVEECFLYNKLGNAMFTTSPETLYEIGEKNTNTVHEKLGISSQMVEGELVEAGYVNANYLSGVIDYSKINKSSFEAFGFDAPSKLRENALEQSDSYVLSHNEMASLTEKEAAAITFFTSNQFEWINETLYEKNGTPSKKHFLHKPYLAGENLDRDNYPNVEPDGRTSMLLEEITSHIDSALAKAPKIQRKLYRGIASHNKRLREYDDNKGGAAKYVKDNFTLGQEIIMDGYQSTSLSPDTGINFASENGVLLEIISSSGLNITSRSKYIDEEGVLLPRNSRYMVVGVHAPRKLNSRTASRENVTVVQLIEIDGNGAITDKNHTQVVPALTNNQKWGDPNK